MVIVILYLIEQFKRRRSSSVTIFKQLKKEIKHRKDLQESTIIDALRHTISANYFDEHIIACTILFAKYTFHFHPSMIAPETRHAIEQERIEIAEQPDFRISNIYDGLMLPYRPLSRAARIFGRMLDCYLCEQMFEQGDMLTAMVCCPTVCHTECLAKYFTAKKKCNACSTRLAGELRSNMLDKVYRTRADQGKIMIPKMSMAGLFERHIYVPNNHRLRFDSYQ